MAGVTDGVLYQWNRAERQVARQDVPLAKVVQTEEEERQQKEALERLENLKRRYKFSCCLDASVTLKRRSNCSFPVETLAYLRKI